MNQNSQKFELISIVSNKLRESSRSLMIAICGVTRELYLLNPMEDEQLLIDEENQALNGIWQQALFESDLKYGEAYLEGLNEMTVAKLSPQDIKNQQIIQQHDPQNWYYFEDNQLRLATPDDLIEAINQVDIDVATETATEWNELECSPAMRYALGLDMY